MKKQNLIYLLLLGPVALWAQDAEGLAVEDNTLDVVIVEEAAPAAEPEIVEIPAAEIEGATRDIPTVRIPEADVIALEGRDVVLELPGRSTDSQGSATMSAEETISVDFPDEDVRTILRNVADLFDLNLVIPDTLQGRTSIKLRNVTWRQVFEVVLEPLGYTYVEDRNILRIRSVEDLTQEPVDTRVFIVNFANARDLRGSVAPLVNAAAGGRIEVDVRSNALVITERPSRMNKIQEIIERLDRATDQVMIESKFIEVTNTDGKNIGVNWASLSGYGVRAGPFERTITNTETDEFNRTRTYGRAGANLAPSNLAEIEAARQADFEDNQLYDRSVYYPDPFFEGLGERTLFSDTFTDLKSTVDTAVFSADQFEVILSALKTNNDVKLVSNPTVVTLNNTAASISIGERYPIPRYSFNAQTGQRQLDDIEYEPIGINLNVTPQVNSSGFINLDIIPEVSSRLGFALVEGTQIPIIASRRTETSIMIKDGFTLAIGGLVENNVRKEGTKVPLLGDLPGIGRFFSSTSDLETQRNLIIFITAKTLNPDGSTYQDVVDPRVINRMGVLPSDLPGYQVPEDEIRTMDRIAEMREEALRQTEIRRLQESLDAMERAKALEEAEAEVDEDARQRRTNRRL